MLIAWLGLTLAPESADAADAASMVETANPQAQATLSGTVTNAATGRNLEGARVVLQDTGRQVLTDSDGMYRFTNVAPGSVTLSVSYTGLDPVAIPVQVVAGSPNRHDVGLTAEIYRMSAFTVSGEREGKRRLRIAPSGRQCIGLRNGCTIVGGHSRACCRCRCRLPFPGW